MLLSINHAERGFDYLMPWSLGCNFDSEGNLKEKQYDIQTDLLKYQLVLEKYINSQRRQNEILFPPSPPPSMQRMKNEIWEVIHLMNGFLAVVIGLFSRQTNLGGVRTVSRQRNPDSESYLAPQQLSKSIKRKDSLTGAQKRCKRP